MQVETRRQQASGQGMEENWAHHRPITILRERTQNKQEEPLTTKIPDIESEHKCDRDQVRIFLNNQTVLFKLILLKLYVHINEPISLVKALLFQARPEEICM